MDALRLATDTTPEFVMLTRDAKSQVIGERSLTRDKRTGKMAMEYLDKTGLFEQQVIVCRTERGEDLQEGDLMLVSHTLSADHPLFYIDTVVSLGDHHVFGAKRMEVPYHWDFCHKILATSDQTLRVACDLSGTDAHVSLASAQVAFPEHLFITAEMIDQAGFTVTEDNGQYVKAKERKSKNNVKRNFTMNREGSYISLKTDGNTRTVFSGQVETAEEFFTIIKCAH